MARLPRFDLPGISRHIVQGATTACPAFSMTPTARATSNRYAKRCVHY